jgi:ferredoxin--NADP+ reductase
MTRLEDYDIEKQYRAKVKESNRITPEESEEEVRDIFLEVDAKDHKFEIGQNIGVLIPGPHEFGHDTHFRLYTIANLDEAKKGKKLLINICVKRVAYIDDYSGERYDGIASNYLCDLSRGDEVTLAGPYGQPFDLPEDKHANLLLIGMGTGIAPFRALVKRIYHERGDWKGKVRLFYGAKSGLEMLYMNDKNGDLKNYYDEETFKAFEAVSPRPHMDDPIALDHTLEQHSKEVWKMILQPDTYVYVAGLEKIRDMLDKAFIKMAGSKEKWERRKAELVAGKRWAELLY